MNNKRKRKKYYRKNGQQKILGRYGHLSMNSCCRTGGRECLAYFIYKYTLARL
jgi:hypothetical protein